MNNTLNVVCMRFRYRDRQTSKLSKKGEYLNYFKLPKCCKNSHETQLYYVQFVRLVTMAMVPVVPCVQETRSR